MVLVSSVRTQTPLTNRSYYDEGVMLVENNPVASPRTVS